MSILSVTQHRTDRGSALNEEGVVTFSRTFIVCTDDAAEGLKTITEASGIPEIGDEHPEDSTIRCISLTPKPDGDSGFVWLVEAKYSNRALQNPVSPSQLPWFRKPVVSWGAHSIKRDVSYDANGNAVANSAGTPYGTIQREMRNPTATIVRYERVFDQATAHGYMNKVNSADTVVAGFAVGAGEALLTTITATPKTIDGQYCWEVVYNLLFDPEGWVQIFPDMGLFYIAEDSGLTIHVHDDWGEKVEEEQYLDGDGHLLDPGEDIVLNSFVLYPSVDFGPLNLNFIP